jgi:hypothetical protein
MSTNFLLAGDRTRLSSQNDTVFLQSSHRVKKDPKLVTLYHRNDYSTVLRFPNKFFKENFHFERASSIYHTKLTWKDIPSRYIEVWNHIKY